MFENACKCGQSVFLCKSVAKPDVLANTYVKHSCVSFLSSLCRGESDREVHSIRVSREQSVLLVDYQA